MRFGVGALGRAVRAPASSLTALRGRPGLLRLQGMHALAITGKWTESVAITVAAFRVGGAELVAVALLARKVPSALLGPALGASIERRAPLTVLRAAVSLSAVLAAVSAVAVVDERGVAVAIVAGSVLGLCGVARRVANGMIVPTMIGRTSELTAVAVIYRGLEAAGLFLGPALAGALIAVGQPATAFAAVAVLNVGGMVLLADLGGAGTTVPRRAGSASLRPVRWARAAELVRPLRNGDVRLLLSLALVQATVHGGFSVLVAPLAIEELGLGEGGVGLLTAAFGVGSLVGSVILFGLAGSARLGVTVVVGLLLWGAPLVVLLGADVPAPVIGALVVVGVGDVVFQVALTTALQRVAQPSRLGRSFAALETVHALGFALGVAISAAAADVAASTTLAVLGGVLGGLALIAFPLTRLLDHRIAAPADAVAVLRERAVFELLPAPALERLALQLRREAHAPGTEIVVQGEPGSRYHLIERGRVSVSVDGRVVGEMGAGDDFGEVALVRSSHRTATCTASTATVTWSIEGDDVLAVLGSASSALDEVADARLSRAAPTAGGA
ncbi:MAG TPA: cyclic nucleotide-binding domain-containing protein [Acidimicrobiales bacterium]|nr:cyclic nucleotide-binding domain-containing protein [Acidimicrobiales bacterium]